MIFIQSLSNLLLYGTYNCGVLLVARLFNTDAIDTSSCEYFKFLHGMSFFPKIYGLIIIIIKAVYILARIDARSALSSTINQII